MVTAGIFIFSVMAVAYVATIGIGMLKFSKNAEQLDYTLFDESGERMGGSI